MNDERGVDRFPLDRDSYLVGFLYQRRKIEQI